jgi:hypothetical protein
MVFLPPHITKAAVYPDLSRLDDICPTDRPISPIFMILRQATCGKLMKGIGPNDMRILMNIADCQILNYITDSADAPESALPRTALLAAQLYLYVALRQYPAKSPLVQILTKRVRAALANIATDMATWSNHGLVLLWCVCVGAAAAEDQSEMKTWFSTRLIIVASLCQAETRDDLQKHLNWFLWDSSFFENTINTVPLLSSASLGAFGLVSEDSSTYDLDPLSPTLSSRIADPPST